MSAVFVIALPAALPNPPRGRGQSRKNRHVGGFCDREGGKSEREARDSRVNQLLFPQILARLHDLSLDRRCRHHVRGREIEFAWSTASGKVSILGAHGNCLSIRRRTR